MKLNRFKINQMVDAGQVNIGGRKSGGGSGAGGGGGVSATWVDDNYISKAFFARLFTVHSNVVTQDDPHGEVIEPNDAETTIDNIETLIDFWSVGNVSALGPAGSGGGGGGVTLYEPLASINSANLGTPTSNGQVIMWNAALSKWVYGIPSGGSSLTMQTVWQNLAASTTEQIALTHLTTALTGYVKTADLSTLTIGKADKLSTAQNLWGQSFDGSAEVKGTLEHVTNIQLQELSANTGAQIKFFYGGANSITSYIHENQSGSLSINGQIFVTNNGNVGIGGSPSGSKLNISGDAKASNLESAGYVKAASYLSAGSYITATTYISATTTITAGTSITAGTTLNAGTNIIAGSADGTFIQIGNIRIGYDQANDGLEVYKLSGSSHASANLYARGNVSALGPAASGGGGGVSLNQPLSGINSSGLSAPTTNGQILMYDSSTGKWKYGTVGLTMDTVWNQLSNPTNQQINISHLTNALSGYSTSDTKNTAGAIQNNSVKLWLVGAATQGDGVTTYCNNGCYIDGSQLYSNGSVVLTSANAVTLDTNQTITGVKKFTNSIYLNTSGTCVFLKDSTGHVYGGVCDSNENFWLGAAYGSTYHHSGTTFISTGWYESASVKYGRATAYIAVPKNFDSSGNAGGFDAYGILHEGNYYLYAPSIKSLSGIEIVSGNNLDNIVSAGTYYCQGGATASGVSNTPYTSGNFRLWHILNTGTDGNANSQWSAQIILAPNDARMFIRSHSGNSFGSWKEFATTGNVVTLADAQTISGAKTFSDSITIANSKAILFNNTSNTAVNVLSFNSSNNLVIGWDVRTTSDTYITGKTIQLTVAGTSSVFYATNAGNVGIGTSVPGTTYRLNVNGTLHASGIKCQDLCIECASDGSADTGRNGEINRYSGGLHLQYNSSANMTLCVGGGKVGIGMTAPAYTLDVSGTINATAIKVNGVDVLTTTVSSLTVTGTMKTNHLQVGQDGGNGTYSISTYNNDASIQINGNSIGIGGTNTSYKFYVNGTSCLNSDVLINATALPTGVTAKLYVKGDTCFDSGNVGIGTAPNSGYRLKVSGKTYMTALEVQGTSTASQNFTLTWNSDGYYELGTISGTNTEIRTAGQWYGVWRGASDIRKKNIIKNLSVCVEKIADAPIFDFTWKVGDDKGVYLGTSAQYIQQIFPSAVSKMKDGYLGLDYSATALAAAVMTARKVVDHERRILELEAEIKRLKEEMAS